MFYCREDLARRRAPQPAGARARAALVISAEVMGGEMPRTQEWVARENIARFRQLIAEAKSDEERARLGRLLAEEELKRDEAERRRREAK